MKRYTLWIILFLLTPTSGIGQTQIATTSDGRVVILNADGTWKYAEVAISSEGKVVILNADGTWKNAEVSKANSEAEKSRKAQKEAERKRSEEEQKRIDDIFNRTKSNISTANNAGTSTTSEGITGGAGNQGVTTGSVDSKVRGTGLGTDAEGVSFDLAGRSFQSLPTPNYDYQGEGKIVVEVFVDRSGNVTQANSGAKGSTTLDEYLLRVAKEAALKAKFEPKPDAPAIQKGTITYNFTLK